MGFSGTVLLYRYEMVRVTGNTLESQENGKGQFSYLLNKVDYNGCFLHSDIL